MHRTWTPAAPPPPPPNRPWTPPPPILLSTPPPRSETTTTPPPSAAAKKRVLTLKFGQRSTTISSKFSLFWTVIDCWSNKWTTITSQRFPITWSKTWLWFKNSTETFPKWFRSTLIYLLIFQMPVGIKVTRAPMVKEIPVTTEKFELSFIILGIVSFFDTWKWSKIWCWVCEYYWITVKAWHLIWCLSVLLCFKEGDLQQGLLSPLELSSCNVVFMFYLCLLIGEVFQHVG